MRVAPEGDRPPVSVRKRLWQAAFAMTVLVMTLAIGNALIDEGRALRVRDLGHDFLAFYTAGTFVRDGRADQLYDLPAVRDYQFSVAREIDLELGPGFMPWWNPPFAVLPFAALSELRYRTAMGVWWAISVAAAIGAVALLVRMLPEHARRDWRLWGLVPALVVPSVPMLLTFSHGQNTAISLLLVCGVATFWRADRPVLAGAVCGLLAYKPQLAAVLAAVLVIRLGPRALLGLCATGLVLLAVTLLMLPGTLTDWLTRMPANLTWFQEANAYYWERHATFKAFWRLLIQGHASGPTNLMAMVGWWTCAMAVILLLARCCLHSRARRGVSRNSSDESKIIAATVAAMPLVMPFYFDYDLLLMAVPCMLLAGEVLGRTGSSSLFGQVAGDKSPLVLPTDGGTEHVSQSPRIDAPVLTPLDRWSIRMWGALYVSMMFNVHVGEAMRLNLNVPLLTACALLTVTRAWPAATGAAGHQTDAQPAAPLPLAA
jgi:alpha-1,2-mannosyltransferase